MVHARLLGPGEYLGHVTESTDLGTASVSFTRHAGGSACEPHGHSRPYLCFVLKGGFTELHSASKSCSSGALVWHPAGYIHSNLICQEGAYCLNVEVPFQTLRHACVSDAGPASWAAARLLRALREMQPTDEPLRDIAACLSKRVATSSYKPWLRRARGIVRECSCDDLTLAKIASACEVHPMHLAACYRRAFGHSVKDDVQQRRLTKAAQLLARTDRRVGEIGVECGFYDQSHFTHVFRKRVGFTPVEYRQVFC